MPETITHKAITETPMSNPLPRRRTLHLSIQHMGKETLIYDEQTHKAYCLNPIAAAVWNCCDGATTPAAIAALAVQAIGLPVTEELVQLSLVDLNSDGLLEPESFLPFAVSRRDVVLKLGMRAAIMLPIVVAVMAPTAAQAYSGSVDGSKTPPTQGNTDIFSKP